MKKVDTVPAGYRLFKSKITGAYYVIPKRNCVFCQHCTDIFTDAAGPYRAICELSCEELAPKCPYFVEEEEE